MSPIRQDNTHIPLGPTQALLSLVSHRHFSRVCLVRSSPELSGRANILGHRFRAPEGQDRMPDRQLLMWSRSKHAPIIHDILPVGCPCDAIVRNLLRKSFSTSKAIHNGSFMMVSCTFNSMTHHHFK
jgi:hypothetical protein